MGKQNIEQRAIDAINTYFKYERFTKVELAKHIDCTYKSPTHVLARLVRQNYLKMFKVSQIYHYERLKPIPQVDTPSNLGGRSVKHKKPDISNDLVYQFIFGGVIR